MSLCWLTNSFLDIANKIQISIEVRKLTTKPPRRHQDNIKLCVSLCPLRFIKIDPRLRSDKKKEYGCAKVGNTWCLGG